MDAEKFLRLMQFPSAWRRLDMYPQELAELQLQTYEVGHEDASEHDRNGAFHWWLKKEPSRAELMKLLILSVIDPDQVMAADVRRHILKSKHTCEEMIALINEFDNESCKIIGIDGDANL